MHNITFTFESIEQTDERGLIGLTPTSYHYNKLRLKEIQETLNKEERIKKIKEFI